MKRTRRIDPHSPAYLARQRIWRHNSYLGMCAHSAGQMTSIIRSDTATPAAKHIASQIFDLTIALKEALKERKP